MMKTLFTSFFFLTMVCEQPFGFNHTSSHMTLHLFQCSIFSHFASNVEEILGHKSTWHRQVTLLNEGVLGPDHFVSFFHWTQKTLCNNGFTNLNLCWADGESKSARVVVVVSVAWRSGVLFFSPGPTPPVRALCGFFRRIRRVLSN